MEKAQIIATQRVQFAAYFESCKSSHWCYQDKHLRAVKITSTAAVNPQHLKVEVADDFPNCSYVINRTCQNPMLIM